MNTIKLKSGEEIKTDLSIRFTDKMENNPGLWCIVCPVGSETPKTFLAEEINTINPF